MPSSYTIRDAIRADIDTLVAFTLQEAREAEGAEKAVHGVTRGVSAPFDDRRLASYWVAETADHQVVASISVVTEWSNFHGGDYWWIQSLFVAPEHRGSRLVDALINHVARAAGTAGALELRLYAHNSNHRALRAYQRCGFTVAPYVIMTRKL
jgi:ribosomal protein S18 acetylase RimI-like enzyme